MTTQGPRPFVQQDGTPAAALGAGVRIYNPDGSFSVQPDDDPRMANLAGLQDRARTLRDQLAQDLDALQAGGLTAAQRDAILRRCVRATRVALRLALPDNLDVPEA